MADRVEEAVHLVTSKKSLKFSSLGSLLFIVFLHFYITRMSVDSHYGKVFYKLGLECQNKCALDKQLSYFQKAVFYDPNLIDAYYRMGMIYEKSGQNEKEFRFYKKVATLDYTNADAYFKVGRYYLEKGELDYALRFLLQSERYRSIDDGVYCLATIYNKQKIYKKAVSYYMRLLLRESPLSADACGQIWRISKIFGQYEMVLEEVHQIHDRKEQQKLWEEVDRYIRTDEMPEFMRKQSDEGR